MGTYNYLLNTEKKTVYELGKNVWAYEVVLALSRGKTLEEGLTIATAHYREWWTADRVKELSNDIKNTLGVENLSSGNEMMDPPDDHHKYILVGTRYDHGEIGKPYWGSNDA